MCSAAESERHGDWLAKDNVDCSFSVLYSPNISQKDCEMFSAFLTEFTGGPWPPSDEKDIDSTSPCDREDSLGDQKSLPNASAANSALKVKGEDNCLPSSSQSAESDIPWAQPGVDSAEPSVNFDRASGKTLTERRKKNASRAVPAAIATHGILSYSSLRELTNTTYLRRINLRMQDAACLFPEAQKTMDLVFLARKMRFKALANFRESVPVCMQDVHGKKWVVELECVRSAGQRHVRFTKGWAEMCIALGLSVGKRFRFDRWVQASSADALVTVSVI